MALAIIFEDDSVAYLDAVTNYTKSKASSVSQHPVDRSALVTDHITKDNPTFSLRAVVSSADFNTTYTRPAELVEGGQGTPPISPEQNSPVNGATISNPSTLLDYLPGSIGQILGNTITSDINVDPFRGFTHEVVRDRLDRKSTRLNSSHVRISYAVFCLKKKNKLKLSKIIPTHHTNLTLTPHQLLSPSHHNLTTLHTHFSYAIHLPLVTTDSVPYQPYDY